MGAGWSLMSRKNCVRCDSWLKTTMLPSSTAKYFPLRSSDTSSPECTGPAPALRRSVQQGAASPMACTGELASSVIGTMPLTSNSASVLPVTACSAILSPCSSGCPGSFAAFSVIDCHSPMSFQRALTTLPSTSKWRSQWQRRYPMPPATAGRFSTVAGRHLAFTVMPMEDTRYVTWSLAPPAPTASVAETSTKPGPGAAWTSPNRLALRPAYFQGAQCACRFAP
mmetsp:Transcript_109140/g.260409  ORF Transcript_109140/g.260409 Transcript_109140/m.260409 type:complete len:225 (+) Transcript_109140:645-1319(+)